MWVVIIGINYHIIVNEKLHTTKQATLYNDFLNTYCGIQTMVQPVPDILAEKSQ